MKKTQPAIDKPKRIGLMVPSSNSVMEPDFYLNMPAKWTLHTARMFLEDVTPVSEARMIDEFALPAARDLATVRPDVLVFGCTSAGALRGNAFEEQLMADICAKTGIPCISVAKAVRETLRSLGVSRVAVATPYVEVLNQKIAASLEDDGIQVMRITGLGIVANTEIGTVPGQKIIDLAHKAVVGLEPQALFISCTNFPAVSVLEKIRSQFPFPVISSNQAILDAAVALAASL